MKRFLRFIRDCQPRLVTRAELERLRFRATWHCPSCSEQHDRNGFAQMGFTLIELLVVVAILGVLASVAVPAVYKFLTAGDLSAAMQEAASVQTATDAYRAIEGKFPTSTGQLTGGGYMRGSVRGSYDVEPDGTITGTGGWGETIVWDDEKNTWIEKK